MILESIIGGCGQWVGQYRIMHGNFTRGGELVVNLPFRVK